MIVLECFLQADGKIFDRYWLIKPQMMIEFMVRFTVLSNPILSQTYRSPKLKAKIFQNVPQMLFKMFQTFNLTFIY